MISSLIIPRVEVIWGPYNLTSPSAGTVILPAITSETFGPLVYDVQVSLDDQGQTPNGSMKWNPSGLGFQAYEKCLAEQTDSPIMITFYYVTGNAISFEFYWGGQSDTFGNEMEINVKLVSLLDGLINANFYATAQSDKEEKGISHKDSVAKLESQFGVKDFNLIRYTKKAAEDSSKSIVKMSYNDGSTFMDAVQNLVKDNGNFVFFNNIGTANAVVYGPYSWEHAGTATLPVFPHETAPLKRQTEFDPTIRYVYLIGPNIINSMTRTREWQPPQKSQEISAMLGRKALVRKSSQGSPSRPTRPQVGEQVSSQSSTSPSGVYGSKTGSNIRSDGNENGPKKQDLFTKERASKLSLSTMLCPALVGIKPLDVLLIPNYDVSYIEDWVVNSVEYRQFGAGVEVSIQASRVFGLGEMMVPGTAIYAKSTLVQSVGDIPSTTTSLEIWEKYAWTLCKNPIASVATPVPLPEGVGAEPLAVFPFQGS